MVTLQTSLVWARGETEDVSKSFRPMRSVLTSLHTQGECSLQSSYSRNTKAPIISVQSHHTCQDVCIDIPPEAHGNR